MNESELIHKILSGQTNVFKEIVEKYQQMVFKVCIGFTHDKDDAEDLTQDVFINAYQNLDKFKAQSSLSTWLYKIAVNASLNHSRKLKKNIFQRLEFKFGNNESKEIPLPATDFENPEQILLNEEYKEMVKNALDSLSDKQRTAIVLSKYEDLPQKEIAEIMNITEGAVESLIQRAKANLQKKLLKME